MAALKNSATSPGLVTQSTVSIQDIVQTGVYPILLSRNIVYLDASCYPFAIIETFKAEGITEAWFYDLRLLPAHCIIMLIEGKNVDLITLNVDLYKNSFQEHLGGIRYFNRTH